MWYLPYRPSKFSVMIIDDVTADNRIRTNCSGLQSAHIRPVLQNRSEPEKWETLQCFCTHGV